MTREDKPGQSAPVDQRAFDDPARLADEAREQREKMASDLRSAKVPIETEPATTYRP